MTVTTDVSFAAGPPELSSWSEALLDAYAPSGATAAPLVVVLPPHSLTKDNPASVQLATARLTAPIPVRFPPELLEEIRRRAAEDDRSVSSWIRRAVEHELQRPA